MESFPPRKFDFIISIAIKFGAAGEENDGA